MKRALPCVALCLFAGVGWGQESPDGLADLRAEVRQMRGEVLRLAQSRNDESAEVASKLESIDTALATLRLRADLTIGTGFLAAPPPGSDVVGVAKTALFAPRLVADTVRGHESVSLVLRRVEVDSTPIIAELELGRDEPSLSLPIDRSGALYVLEWRTGEGMPYALQLADGSGGPEVVGAAAATVQVRPLQSQGRFLFVGYRVD